MNWQAADGCRLFGQIWTPGEDSLALVCLVHGLGEHSGRYAHVASALTAAGYALSAFDLRGHGRSEGPRGHSPSYQCLIQDIGDFVARFRSDQPGKPVFIYGHSLGGALVINYVLQSRPDIAGVIVTSPGLRPAVDPPAWKTTMGRLTYNLAPAIQMANGLDLSGLSHDPAIVRAYRDDPLVHDRVSARLGMDILTTGPAALAQAATFPPIPLLIMQGTADRIVSSGAAGEFAARVPGDCTLKLWEGYYHELHNEPQRAEVLAYIIGWLNAHTPANAGGPD